MYNGIGLNTPRGSGTNGYVQANAACVRTRKDPIQYLKDDHFKGAGPMVYRKTNVGLVEHERKRQIELKCLELRERLEEEEKLSEEMIEKKVCELRKSLLNEGDSGKKELLSKDQARVKLLEEKQRKLRDALGLASDKEAQPRVEKPKPARPREMVPSSSEDEGEGEPSSDDSVSSLSSSSDSEEEKKRKLASHKKMKRRQRDVSDERRPSSKRSRHIEERSSHVRSKRDHQERHSHPRRS